MNLLHLNTYLTVIILNSAVLVAYIQSKLLETVRFATLRTRYRTISWPARCYMCTSVIFQLSSIDAGHVVSVDAVRRRKRLSGLLATIQSNVRPDNASNRGRTAAAFVTMTTTAADHNVDGVSDGVAGGPFVARHKAMSFTSTRRRDRRSVLRQGIVCECCVHQCDIHELQEYCRSTPNN